MPDDLLVDLIDAFHEWNHKNRAPDTDEWYQYRLQWFVSRYPVMRVTALKPFRVAGWVDAYDIAVSTRRSYFRSIKRCLTLTKRLGWMDEHPLEARDISGSERKEIYVPPEEFERLLSFVPAPSFRDLCVITPGPPRRPQESLRLLADYVDLKNGRWVFPQEKSKGKKAMRIIDLNDESFSITDPLLEAHPEGEGVRNS